MNRFDGLQAQVENLEARVASYETGGPSPSVWASASAQEDPAVEEALQQLKDKLAGGNTPQAASKSPAESKGATA
jgi:hypothetical protein